MQAFKPVRLLLLGLFVFAWIFPIKGSVIGLSSPDEGFYNYYRRGGGGGGGHGHGRGRFPHLRRERRSLTFCAKPEWWQCLLQIPLGIEFRINLDMFKFVDKFVTGRYYIFESARMEAEMAKTKLLRDKLRHLRDHIEALEAMNRAEMELLRKKLKWVKQHHSPDLESEEFASSLPSSALTQTVKSMATRPPRPPRPPAKRTNERLAAESTFTTTRSSEEAAAATKRTTSTAS